MASSKTDKRRLFVGRQAPWAQAAMLVALSLVLVVPLELAGLPAALLLGPMIAGIVIAAGDGVVRVPPTLYVLAQGVLGCLMARAMPASVLSEIGREWPIFLTGIVSVIVVANGLGWLLAKWRVLPGSTAIWGASPGAASAMVIMAEAYGADFRLVAFMQYVRVVCVAVAASLVARLWATGDGSGQLPGPMVWFPPPDWVPLIQTLALGLGGALVGRALRFPAGAMLVPMALGILLQDTGAIAISLPPWLLALSYTLVGWAIGLRFTRAILVHAARALPQILASMLTLILICGGFAAFLVHFAGIDPLTAYLATSPGGADSVAIIAASSKVDVPFVVAMQTARFLVVLVTGPSLARLIVKWTGARDKPG